MKAFSAVIRLTLALFALTASAACSTSSQTGVAEPGPGDSLTTTATFSGPGDSLTTTPTLSAPGDSLTVAPTYVELYDFGWDDGARPRGVIIDNEGNLYGTTKNGGHDISLGLGYGTVFKLDTSGKLTLLHIFDFTDGAYPEAKLVMDDMGDFYSTTSGGGAFGFGTVFKLDKSNLLTVLHHFSPASGGTRGGLVTDNKGNFYGTTVNGGASGNGTVFKIDRSGTMTVLYEFTGEGGAGHPGTTLFRDDWGNLYGGTGRELSGAFGYGMVFKLAPSGTMTVLYNFKGTDGMHPNALIMDKYMNLYGTTHSGGEFNHGTVFKLNKCGESTVLHSFWETEGGSPYAGVIMDDAGNIYGTNASGNGYFRGGDVFRLDSKGKLTLLVEFYGSNGSFPIGELIMDDKANIYGTTNQGGWYSGGKIFKIALGNADESWIPAGIAGESFGSAETAISEQCVQATM